MPRAGRTGERPGSETEQDFERGRQKDRGCQHGQELSEARAMVGPILNRIKKGMRVSNMSTKGAKVKIGFAAAGVILALIAAWIVIDPLSSLVLLLDVAKDVNVDVNTRVPLSAILDKEIYVGMPKDFRANVLVKQQIDIPVDETVNVPIDVTVNAPVEADVLVDQVLDLKVDVPIDVVLTPQELSVEKLKLLLDTELFVDDTLLVETTLPLDTSVKSILGIRIPVKGNVPVKMAVPVKQKVRVKDEIAVNISEFRAPLKTILPVHVQVPVKQMLHDVGNVRVPIRQTIPIHIKQIVGATLPDAIPVSVAMDRGVPVALKATLDFDVKIIGTVPIQLGTLAFKKGSARLVKKQ